jgi:hypothetical protein
VAFCAKEKTEEKNPLVLPEGFWDSGVRVPGVLLSSMVGVKGVIAFDSLLDCCVAESDLARRCETIFPDAETMVVEFVPAGNKARGFANAPLKDPVRASVGVGGVTVVRGASIAVLGGVFGDIASEDTPRPLVPAFSNLLGCGLITTASGGRGLGGLTTVFELLISFPGIGRADDGFPLLGNFSYTRSGLVGELLSIFRGPFVNIFLILVPGEIVAPLVEPAVSVVPRDFSLGSTPRVEAWRGASSAGDEGG